MPKAAAALLALLATLVTLVLGVATATAQDAPEIVIRSVDATDPAAVEVTFGYAGARGDLTDLAVREGDFLVDTAPAVPLTDRQTLGIVLVIDASGSMNEGALIERVLEAARTFVESKAPADEVAIVTFNRTVSVVQGFTADSDVLLEALDEVPLAAETALYDAIVRASALFDESDLQPNLIVFSDGEDSISTASSERALGAVQSVGGSVHAMGLDSPGFGALREIADATGGSAAVADDPSQVAALFESAQASLGRQYVVTFASRAEGGATVPLTLTIGDEQATVEFVAGSEHSGTSALQPVPAGEPSGPAFFRSSTGLLVALALAAVAAAVAVLSLGGTFLGKDKTLNEALEPYGGYALPVGMSPDDVDEERGQQFAQTQFVQRAVHATGELAKRQGVFNKAESMLEQANLSLRPAEAIFFYGAGVVVMGVLLLALTGALLPGLIGTVLVALIPPATLNYLASRRRKQFNALLPDTLNLLASTMRAGYSLMQGVEAVSREVSEPVGRELRRVVTESRLGRPLEESLDGVAERMQSADFAWAVMAIRIQREVGGNLAELLVTVADTMTERERLRRDVAALTAEGKISAIVLGLLPLGLGAFIYTANPEYMDPLFEKTVGKIMLFGAIGWAFFGFWWMKKTIEIEI